MMGVWVTLKVYLLFLILSFLMAAVLVIVVDFSFGREFSKLKILDYRLEISQQYLA